MPSIPHTSTPSPAPTPTPVKPSHSTSVPKLTRRVPPLLLPTKFHRNSIASSITSPRSRSSAADLSTGPPTPKSSRLEIPDPSIRDDSNSEADERARFRIPTLTISRDSLSTKPRHDRSVSASFDFKPFTIDPLIVAPPHRVVSAQGSSSLRSPPTRPPSSVSSPMDRGSSNEGALMKLGRGLFRSASRNGQRSPTPVVAAPPAPGHSDHGDVITIGKRSSQRLEPLVESWVMEQLDAPPPSPSAQEVAAYYSDGGKIPRPKSRRSFSGLLRLGGPR
ncbi:hypothetical protein DL93DRAFT_2087038 [Clavulina sp. PMI_390]|nr:hypothetical protein DL93DRAFT_2087038 [Clavulina sp. PMI_390]